MKLLATTKGIPQLRYYTVEPRDSGTFRPGFKHMAEIHMFEWADVGKEIVETNHTDGTITWDFSVQDQLFEPKSVYQTDPPKG